MFCPIVHSLSFIPSLTEHTCTLYTCTPERSVFEEIVQKQMERSPQSLLNYQAFMSKKLISEVKSVLAPEQRDRKKRKEEAACGSHRI